MQNSPYVIGIAGGSASGKTTFTKLLVNELNSLEVCVFHMDEYFKAPEARPQSAAPVNGRFIWMTIIH